MDTKVSMLDESNLDEVVIKEAATVIKSGGTVVFPTETVYGLGANALDSEAVKKIFVAKGRPQDNPLIIHVADKKIERYVDNISEKAKLLMDKFWPGPLTLLFNKKDIIPTETTAGLNTVGVRMPENEIALTLIRESGVPIAAPSANVSGKPSPTEVKRCVEDLNGKVDYIIGGSRSNVGLESTIVDCTSEPLCVLRPGGITLEMLKIIDENVYVDPHIMNEPTEDFKPKAPGMKYRHYAPKAKVRIVLGEEGESINVIKILADQYELENKKVGIMICEEHKSCFDRYTTISLGSRENLIKASQELFETLRKFDELGVDIILCEGYNEKGLGLAIMNRLKKAAGFDIIHV